MAEPIKFTELTNAGELSLSAIMAIVQQQAGELVSLQCSMAQVAELVASGATYQELTTEQKTLISAINEIAAGGGGGGGAYFFAEGQATAAQIRERYNSGLMCFLIANDDTIYPLTAIDAEYIQGERVEGVFFAKAFGYSDNISVTVKYIPNDAGVEVSSVGFTGVANSRVTNDMSATNGKIPTDDAVRSYVTEYIRTRLAQKLDLDLNNISASGEQKIRDIAGGGGSGVDPVARAGVEEVKADLSLLDNSVDLLYKLTQGQSWDFVDQTEHGMNLAPKGTKVQSLLSVEGKSEQFTTNGYQLLENKESSRIVQGVNFDWKDNILRIHGTSNGSGSNIASPYWRIPQGTYTITHGELTGLNNFYFDNDDWSVITIMDKVKTVTLNKDYDKFRFIANVPAGVTIDLEVRFMLETGSTAHDWEPYTGGIPSPNPDYPQEITSVEELNFSVGGRNLFDEQTTVTDGYLYSKNYISVKPNTKYFIPVTTGNTSNDGYQIIFYNADMVQLSDTFVRGTLAEQSFTTPNGCYYIKFRCFTSYGNVYKNNIIVSIVNVPYTPYREPQTKQIIPPFALNKVGDIADVADVERGIWERAFSEERFNAEDTWIYERINGVSNFYTEKKTLPSNLRVNALSNYGRFTGRLQNKGEMITSSSNLNIIGFYELNKTVDDFKALLNGNDLIIIYPLETPVETSISAEDLSFLKSLQNLNEDNVITITDQNGNDITYAMKYLIKLSEAI